MHPASIILTHTTYYVVSAYSVCIAYVSQYTIERLYTQYLLFPILIYLFSQTSFILPFLLFTILHIHIKLPPDVPKKGVFF